MDIKESIGKILDQPTLYPNLPRKSREQRESDLLAWHEKYGEVNANYNLYGLDVEGLHDADDFLDNGIFRSQRYKANSTFYPAGSEFPYDYSIVFRDKRLFDAYYARIMPQDLPVTYGYLVNGEAHLFDGSTERFLAAHDGEHVAVKQTFGCHGVNLKSCRIEGGSVVCGGDSMPFDEFVKSVSGVGESMWIIQKWLVQHSVMSEFNPTSINTLRIVSYNTGKRVVVGNSSLLVGPAGSIINNPEAGNETLYGISNEGVVSDFAYSFFECSRTSTPFAGTVIPHYMKARDLVRRAHEAFPEVFTVGWDVVIGPDGPILLEGNDGWSPRAIQVPTQQGERARWTELLEERMGVYAR